MLNNLEILHPEELNITFAELNQGKAVASKMNMGPYSELIGQATHCRRY